MIALQLVYIHVHVRIYEYRLLYKTKESENKLHICWECSDGYRESASSWLDSSSEAYTHTEGDS